jgi:hypothetical protein
MRQMRPTLLFYSSLTPDDFTRQEESTATQWVHLNKVRWMNVHRFRLVYLVFGFSSFVFDWHLIGYLTCSPAYI